MNDIRNNADTKAMKKATNKELIESYFELKSVWKVADKFGMCGQSVHERLTRNGIKLFGSKLSSEEILKIKMLYEDGFESGDGKLEKLSKDIGRPINTISYHAKKMGLSKFNRNKHQSIKDNISKNTKQFIKTNGHPRGALGIKHSKETKKILSIKSRQMWQRTTPVQRKIRGERFVESLKKSGKWKRPEGYSRTVSGKRIDLNNQYFRSRTEANFARFLKLMEIPYEYETKEFIFEDIRRGVIAYTPDFYIPQTDTYYEIKGWLDRKSITRLRRFATRYKNEFLKTKIVKQSLTKKDYAILLNKIKFKPNQIINFKTIEKYKLIIPNWE